MVTSSQKTPTDKEKEYAVERNGSKWTPIVIAVIGAAFGSLSTVSIYLGTPIGQEIVRPDPFTGQQGLVVTQRLDQLEAVLGKHTNQHPDTVNRFDRRIATLEAQYALILANQGRILDRLDKL